MRSTPKIIDLVTPRFPEGCFDRASISNARALLERLPRIFSSYNIECRLTEGRDQVDLLACMAASPGGDHRERIRVAALQPPSDFSREPGWRFVWDVLHRWSSPDLEWYGKIPCVWIEFDHINISSSMQRAPSLWACIDPSYRNASLSTPPWDQEASYELCMDFLAPSIPPEFAELLSVANRRLMSVCFSRLPPRSRIIYVSFMLARIPTRIKLFGAIPRDHLVEYLASINWPGPVDLLENILQTFYTADTADDTVYFDLELDNTLLPYVGIVFSQLQLRRALSSDPRRSALLRLFERHGLCDRDGREALESWPGSARESHPGTRAQARIHRWLDAKVTLHPDRRVGAKAYLGFAPVLSIF